MQSTLLSNQPKSSKKLYYAALAVFAVVGLIGCGVYMKPFGNEMEMEPIMGGEELEEVPHYIRNMWENWKIKYEKEYTVEEEDEERVRIFYSNVQFITAHESKPDQSYTLAINKFSDLSQEEFAAMYLSPFESTRERNVEVLSEDNLSGMVDWRTKGAVNKVKNQGHCGSCWAFSAVAALEAAMQLKTSTLESYSEQQLVDCSKKAGNNGCEGGLMDHAFKWYETNAADFEMDYKYTAKDGKCKEKMYTPSAAKTMGYTDVQQDSVSQLQAAIDKTVVSVAVEADKSVWQHYSSGILDSAACGTKLDHGVAAVGYDSDAGYWLVRNSWGADWGMEGYIQLAMNVSSPKGQCGILQAASYPKV